MLAKPVEGVRRTLAVHPSSSVAAFRAPAGPAASSTEPATMRNAAVRIWNNPPEAALPAVRDPDHQQAIRESHDRCAALGLTRIDTPDHSRIIRSDLALARERTQRLCNHAAPVMEMLFGHIAGTESMIVLCDAQGTVLHAVGDDSFLERAAKVALAPGANWAEQSKGTNAVGTALFEERPTLVHADEHFMHANGFLTCSAAPIFDPRGSILGVLDVSGDHRSYHRHTMGLVRMSARMIENHWLGDACSDRLRLHFHHKIEFIGTLMEGILVVGADGRILGANQSALDQLGVSGVAVRNQTLESLFGMSPAQVIDHFSHPMPNPLELRLPDGHRFFGSARFHWTPPLHVVAARDAHPASAGEVPEIGGGNPPPPRGPRGPQGPSLARLATGDGRLDVAIDKLKRVLDHDVPLLLIGEGGTGRETIAQAAHAESRRANRPFVVVRCGANGPDALEAEIFGAPDADLSAAPAALARAAGGTLLLTDVDALPPALQARLAGLLQSRREDGRPRLDLWLVCSTRIELRDAIAEGRFREDLYHRINGLALRLPPLRERSDLEALCRRVLEAQNASPSARISAEALAVLRTHHWPGNLTQLVSVLRTAAVLAGDGGEIRTEHLPEELVAPPVAAAAAPASLEEAEVEMIRRAVEEAGGNISVAARRLSISRNTIYRKLRWKPPH
jgi:transcriptional regulator of acetoin/glycerol metabolism